MTPEVERFLDLATRPLEAVPGEREEAKGELMSRIAHDGLPYELLDLAEPLERLEKAKPGSRAPRRGILLSGMLLLTAAASVGVGTMARDVYLMFEAAMMSFQFTGPGMGRSYDQGSLVMKRARSVAPDLPLGLHPAAGGVEETADRLAENPDDLAILQEHIIRRLETHDGRWNGFTPDEQQTIDRLDGDNALWPLMQVMPHLALAFSSNDVFAPGTTGFTLADEAEYLKALQRFSEAAGKPRYLDRSTSLKRRQLDALPPVRSLSEQAVADSFTGMVSSPLWSAREPLFALATLHCERLVAAGDKAGLEKFFNEWKQLIRCVGRSTDPYHHNLAEMATPLAESFDKLGMAAERAEVGTWKETLGRARRSSPASTELESSAGMRLQSHQLPSGLTKDEVMPSRLAELAFLDRIVTGFLTTMAIAFTVLTGLEICRRSRLVKNMARGLMPLFRKEDHLWIAGLGIVLPWTWWWVISRLSPLGLRDANMEIGWPMTVWLIQSAAGFIFGMVMLLQAARWRWSVRGGFIGLGVSLPWIGWGVAALTGLSMPLAGVLRYLDPATDDQAAALLLGATGMAACGLLWLLWQGIAMLFTPRSGALRPNLTMCTVLPWAMAGATTLLACVTLATAMERHWHAKDPLLSSWTSKTYLHILDERVAKEARETLSDL